MLYRNLSRTTKTFYGVTFNPGEVHNVPGYINDRLFIPVNELPTEPPVSSKITSGASAKSTDKSAASSVKSTDKSAVKSADKSVNVPKSSKAQKVQNSEPVAATDDISTTASDLDVDAIENTDKVEPTNTEKEENN